MAVWSEVEVKSIRDDFRLDATYYTPEILSIISKLKAMNSEPLGEIADLYTGRTPNYTEEGDIDVVRSGDLVSTLIYPDCGRNFLKTFKSAKLFYLKDGDVLISSIGFGSIGKISLVIGSGSLATVSEVTVIRNTKYPPEYIFAFLSTVQGQRQIDRQITGATGQLHLLKSRVGKTLIPPYKERYSKIIALCKKAHAKEVSGIDSYHEAMKRLIEELGLNKKKFSDHLFYDLELDEVRVCNRTDAGFFHPKYYELLKLIDRTGRAERLGKVLDFCERGKQPEYTEEGAIAVVNTKHLGAQLHDSDFERCTEAFWTREKHAQLNKFDVLMYGTGAYIGRTNCFFYDGKAIGSNHVNIIRPNACCNPIYLSMFLNSVAGLMQADRHAHGSAQREVYPDDVKNFTVWLAPDKLQKEIADLVTKAYLAREESRQLLDEAKKMVEGKIAES